MQKNLLIITGIIFILEFYVYQAFKTLVSSNWLRIGYWVITLLVYGFFVFELLNFRRSDRSAQTIQIVTSVFLIFILPKLFIVFFLILEDVARFFNYLLTYFAAPESYYPERRKFVSITGVAVAGIFSLLILDGIVFGKYRHRARKVKLKIPGMPAAFKGYRIVQISDFHAGSFLNPDKVRSSIELINKQEADLVLFTGDMVNNYAEEFEPFVKMFAEVKARDGKFSVLGNHDYGDYAEWLTHADKDRNIPYLTELQKQAGFTLLRNEHRAIQRNGATIYLLGVENWGVKPFPQYGDLNKASASIPKDAIKILMSHDPSHFDAIVKHHPSPIHLTLSGHTHGMQFGLDLKNVRWSPVQYRYKKWADLYESDGKYLYVNRGFGVIAYPGRVGIEPEITVIELQ